jgi:hypothetical protein
LGERANSYVRGEGVFQLLNPHDQELTLDNVIQIRNQSALKEAEEPEPKEKTMTVLKLA